MRELELFAGQHEIENMAAIGVTMIREGVVEYKWTRDGEGIDAIYTLDFGGVLISQTYAPDQHERATWDQHSWRTPLRTPDVEGFDEWVGGSIDVDRADTDTIEDILAAVPGPRQIWEQD